MSAAATDVGGLYDFQEVPVVDNAKVQLFQVACVGQLVDGAGAGVEQVPGDVAGLGPGSDVTEGGLGVVDDVNAELLGKGYGICLTLGCLVGAAPGGEYEALAAVLLELSFDLFTGCGIVDGPTRTSI